jgi:hypothetical protein
VKPDANFQGHLQLTMTPISGTVGRKRDAVCWGNNRVEVPAMPGGWEEEMGMASTLPWPRKES